MVVGHLTTMESSFAADAKRILGIDPGSRLCGWGLSRTQAVGSRMSTTAFSPSNGRVIYPNDLATYWRPRDILERYTPGDVAVEGVFQHRNARSALILGHARGTASQPRGSGSRRA